VLGVRGGRVPEDVRRAMAAPAAAPDVPIIGAGPHEVRIQVVTSDQAPPTVIELAAVLAGMLVRITNWTEPVDKIRDGTERQARAMGDGPATISLLQTLEHARTSILALRERAQARARDGLAPESPALAVVDPEPVQAPTESPT
jgi:hypothetical protein